MAAASASSSSPLDALQDLPDSVLLIVVQLLPLAAKRALRSTCRSMCRFVDIHVLHTLQLGPKAEVALPPLPPVCARTPVAWRAVQRRSYHHITCLTFSDCNNKYFAGYFTACVKPSLQHLQEVRIAGSAGTVEFVLKALLGVQLPASADASCPNKAVCSTHDTVASGTNGSSSCSSGSGANLSVRAAGGTLLNLTASCSRYPPPTTSIHTLHCKLAWDEPPEADCLLPLVSQFSGLRTLHLCGCDMFPPEEAAYSSLSTLRALTSLAAGVPPQTLAMWPGLQHLSVSDNVWMNFRPLDSLTALQSLTLTPLSAGQMQLLALHLPPTLTEFRLLHRQSLAESKQELMEAWQLRSLARLDVPTLRVSCEKLTGLVSLTMLSCRSLNERPGQADREAYARVRAAAKAAQDVHAQRTQHNIAAPGCALHSLQELRLHDSGFRSGALPHMCPALTSLRIQIGTCLSGKHVNACSDETLCTAAAQVLFSGGELPGLRSLDLPLHLLSPQAVGPACAGVTNLSFSSGYLWPDFVRGAVNSIAALQQLQQLRICCVPHPDFNVSQGAAASASASLLCAASMCTCLTALEFQGSGAFVSESGLVSLADNTAAASLRVLKLRGVDLFAGTHGRWDQIYVISIIGGMHSLHRLEVECRDDSEALQLAALVHIKNPMLELVVHVACNARVEETQDDFGDTDHDESDSAYDSESGDDTDSVDEGSEGEDEE